MLTKAGINIFNYKLFNTSMYLAVFLSLSMPVFSANDFHKRETIKNEIHEQETSFNESKNKQQKKFRKGEWRNEKIVKGWLESDFNYKKRIIELKLAYLNWRIRQDRKGNDISIEKYIKQSNLKKSEISFLISYTDEMFPKQKKKIVNKKRIIRKKIKKKNTLKRKAVKKIDFNRVTTYNLTTTSPGNIKNQETVDNKSKYYYSAGLIGLLTILGLFYKTYKYLKRD